MEKRIPKIIHYCWFGQNELPNEYKENIESWKKYMPDFKIIEWNENNYDVFKNEYTSLAYKNKKWAFLTDYVRLDVVNLYGGIYLDTDVEVFKSFEPLLDNEAFMGVECGGYVNTGIGFGSKKNNEILIENLKYYETNNFLDKYGDFQQVNCPIITTAILKKNGAKINGNIEELGCVTILPMDYFCPMNYLNGKINITPNTYSIHKYSMSWGSKLDNKQFRFKQFLSRIIGEKMGNVISKVIFFPIKFTVKSKKNGVKRTIKYYLKKERN